MDIFKIKQCPLLFKERKGIFYQKEHCFYITIDIKITSSKPSEITIYDFVLVSKRPDI